MRYIDADEFKRLSKKFGVEQNQPIIAELLCQYIDCLPTEDVVPRAEVEEWKAIAETYQKMFEDSYEAKQEGASSIFEEIEKLLAHHSHTCVGYSEIIGSFYYEKQLGNSIAELKKKYIGE